MGKATFGTNGGNGSIWWQLYCSLCCQIGKHFIRVICATCFSNKPTKAVASYIIFVIFYVGVKCNKYVSFRIKICNEKHFVNKPKNQQIWISQHMFDWLGFKISRTCGHPTPKNAYKTHLKMLKSRSIRHHSFT